MTAPQHAAWTSLIPFRLQGSWLIGSSFIPTMSNVFSDSVAPVAESTAAVVDSTSSSAVVTSAGTVDKVIVHIRAGPGTPILKLEKFKVNASDQYSVLVDFLKKQLRMQPHESLFCYVNMSFVPSYDQSLRDLHQCFAVGDELLIHYCKTEAWG
jgi:ubiquitin-like protein ATG12